MIDLNEADVVFNAEPFSAMVERRTLCLASDYIAL